MLQLIEDLKSPKHVNANEIATFNFLPHFSFGHQNKSYLLFNINLIIDQGILMGCLYEKDDIKANHFNVSGISGEELSNFLNNALSVAN